MTRFNFGSAVILVLIACLSLPQHSSPQSLQVSPDSALIAALAKIDGAPIGLEEVVSGALAHSTSANDARAALAAARATLKQERGSFDPELFADISNSSEKIPSSSPFTGADVLHPQTSRTEAGARITLPTGTELQASVTGQKLETNSAFASLNPEYDASTSLTFRQPLLQGFGPAGWGNYRQAKISYQAAKSRYEDAAAGVRATAETMYWDLYAAERDYAVSVVTRDLARALQNEANVRAAAGLVGPNQVNNAKVFLADQELAVLDAEDNLDRVSNALSSLIGRRPDAANSRFKSLDEPGAELESTSEDDAVAAAFRRNGELRAAELEVSAMRASLSSARWNALPTADLYGAFGGNGLGGTGRDVIFGSDTLRNSLDTKFSDALDQALQRDYPSWTIGLRLSVPILLREKGGERDRMRAELARTEQRYLQTLRSLEERVRATHRELETGRNRLQLSEDGVRASVDQVRIGLIEFQNGVTTAFELVRLGADLANAQRRHSQALVRTAKAAARMRQLIPETAEAK